MKWKIICAAVILVILTIININIIGGSYEWVIPSDLGDSGDTVITMDKEGIVEEKKIVINKESGFTTVFLRAINEGEVNLKADRNLNDNVETEKSFTVGKFGIIYESGFIGSMSNMNIIRYEIIGIILILIVSTILEFRKERKRNRYSYRLMFYTGVVIFLGVNMLSWLSKVSVFKYDDMNRLYSIYGDIISTFNVFGVIVFPFIFLLSLFLIFSNIQLIRHEGRSITNTLGIATGIFLIITPIMGFFTYYILSKLINVSSYLGFHVSYFIECTIFVVLGYFVCMMFGTYFCTRSAGRHVPKYDKDYMIILGCSIRKDGTVTPLLKSRADRALWFAKKQEESTGKELKFVASGGQGDDEVTSEADAIRKYLLESDIPEDRIIIEDKSTTTYENIKFSYQKILEDAEIDSENKEEKDFPKISFSTNSYHVFRSGNIANTQGINATGIGSKTKWYFHINALIREFVANVNLEKRKHIVILSSLIITIALLLTFSYVCQIL